MTPRYWRPRSGGRSRTRRVCPARWASGTTSCAPSSPPVLRSLRGSGGLPPAGGWGRRGARGTRRPPLGAGDGGAPATPYVPRSRSRETTFQQNLTDRAEISAQVSTLARRVAEDVVAEGRPAARVAVKVRFAPFV